MLPVMARDVLRVGASGLGLLSSLGGIGAVLSTLGIASLGDYRRKGSLLVATVASSGGFLLLFGLSHWYVVSLVLVFFVGAALAAYDVTIKAIFLLVASDQVRGRVQSLYTLTYGFMSLGGFAAGSVAAAVGAPVAISASGGIILAFTVRYLRSITEPRPLSDGIVPVGD
jgi:MFS family permease